MYTYNIPTQRIILFSLSVIYSLSMVSCSDTDVIVAILSESDTDAEETDSMFRVDIVCDGKRTTRLNQHAHVFLPYKKS